MELNNGTSKTLNLKKKCSGKYEPGSPLDALDFISIHMEHIAMCGI